MHGPWDSAPRTGTDTSKTSALRLVGSLNINMQIFAVFWKGVPLAGFGPGPTGNSETTRAGEPR